MWAYSDFNKKTEFKFRCFQSRNLKIHKGNWIIIRIRQWIIRLHLNPLDLIALSKQN